jgi:hypothetical protein
MYQLTDARPTDGVDDPAFAITQLAQTTMRSELGKISLDNTFSERESLNEKIVAQINVAAEAWGLRCMRYEIRDILPPVAVKNAMDMQAEAERRKRAQVLDSEGMRESEINQVSFNHYLQYNTTLSAYTNLPDYCYFKHCSLASLSLILARLCQVIHYSLASVNHCSLASLSIINCIAFATKHSLFIPSFLDFVSLYFYQAEGRKQAAVLSASGDAAAMIARAEATATSLALVGKALKVGDA